MYEELLDAWRKETASTDLQPLPGDFYRRLNSFMRRLREEEKLADKEGIQGRLLAKILEVSVRLTENLCYLRLTKIIDASIRGAIEWDKLTEDEKPFVKEASKIFEEYNRMVRRIVEGRYTPVEAIFRAGGLKLIRFKSDTPSFVGVDLKVYGPFKAEDVAYIPEENAIQLVKQGIAIDVEVTE
ncbi:MAG: hypothetical protein N3E44_03805 [Candidatus Bathyarchaeota archaeon]|nr:hypothetical protein [Candidatus Bathyarchaeota archaeon]